MSALWGFVSGVVMRGRGVVLSFVLGVGLAVGFGPVLAECDDAFPDLTGFNFTPNAINTTSAAQTVHCNMLVRDDLSGVASASCMFFSPSFQQTASCVATTASAGTPLNGTYSCDISFPAFSEGGIWTAQVQLVDAVGNQMMYQPQFLGFSYQVTVTSTPDTTAPTLNNFVMNPTSVNVSTAAQNVICTMTVTDALSGVDTAVCAFEAPDSNQGRGCASIAPSSGTRQSGVFSCSFPMLRYSDAGNWQPTVLLRDRVGNFLPSPGVAPLVVTASPEDILAPTLNAFSFQPTSITTGDGVSIVTCSFTVADALSGVASASCTFSYTDPFNPFLSQSQECTGTKPTSGTRQNGTFQCSVVIPRFSVGGLWDVDVQLIDVVGNELDVTPAQQLDVDCSTGDVETTIRFSNKTTITWDPVSGADRYNVYRGTLVGMIDLSPVDQLPDGGYGTCRNSTDANLTDTTFVDAGTPTLAEVGYHYLVSYTSGGIEKGLGQSSYGTARTVTPCP
jgi:hypothetical protein